MNKKIIIFCAASVALLSIAVYLIGFLGNDFASDNGKETEGVESETQDPIELIYNENLNIEDKTSLVARAELSVEDLSGIVESFDNSISVIAMKRICSEDIEKAYEIAEEILKKELSALSDDKQIAACLGVAVYFEKNSAMSPNKQEAIDRLKEIFNSSSNQLVRDQAIYALARICDYELFADIIKDEKIDIELKITVIERNIDIMLEKISTSNSFEDISAIAVAMKIIPVDEIGDALESAVTSGKFEDGEELQELIEYIKVNGVRGMYKQE